MKLAMGALVGIAGLLGFLATDAGWDAFARIFSGGGQKVDLVVTVHPREAFAYQAKRSDGSSQLVLADSQAAAAEELLTQDTEEAAISCLLQPYRVVADDGGWSIALLPNWLAWLGKRSCEHGAFEVHRTEVVMARKPQHCRFDSMTQLEQAIASEKRLAVHDALLAAEVWIVDAEVLPAEKQVPNRVRLQAYPLDGGVFIPIFSSETCANQFSQARARLVPFRLLLQVMNPPKVPLIVNPGSTVTAVITVEELSSLQEHIPPHY